MTELWQLYDESGEALSGRGATKNEVFEQGLLHGAAHVWIWRHADNGLEVLVQRRAEGKRTWPNLLDISAAGHIDLGENPVDAAVRETSEEIGLAVGPEDLNLISKRRDRLVTEPDVIENEWRWVYCYELAADTRFELQTKEVGAIEWKSYAVFKAEVLNNERKQLYVPQGPE
jgi:isopentenyldiphosphate isomerase